MMKRGISVTLMSVTMLFLLLATPTSHAVQSDTSAITQLSASSGAVTLTIYQGQNLALIQDRRTIELTQGISEHQLQGISARLLPESVQLEGASQALQILEQRFENDPVSLEQLLRTHLGQEIEVFAPEGQGMIYPGRLISTQGGIILQEESGKLQVIQDATRFRFPSQDLDGPMLLWTLQSEDAGLQPIQLRYLSEGLDWNAQYTAVMDSSEIALDLESWVSVLNNSGLSVEQAELNLVAGQIHRVERTISPPMMAEAAKAREAPSPFVEAPSFEYHLYTLQRPARLPDGKTVQLAFLQAHAVPMEKKYIYAPYAQDGVQVWVEFNNAGPTENSLPAGIVRLYQRTPGGVEFIGEDRISHTPVGERVKLLAGLAFDIVAKRVQTNHEQLGDRTYRDSFQITLTNRKEEDVLVQVRARLIGDWKIASSDPTFVKLDAQTIEFHVPVVKSGQAVVEYTVEYTLPY